LVASGWWLVVGGGGWPTTTAAIAKAPAAVFCSRPRPLLPFATHEPLTTAPTHTAFMPVPWRRADEQLMPEGDQEDRKGTTKNASLRATTTAMTKRPTVIATIEGGSGRASAASTRKGTATTRPSGRAANDEDGEAEDRQDNETGMARTAPIVPSMMPLIERAHLFSLCVETSDVPSVQSLRDGVRALLCQKSTRDSVATGRFSCRRRVRVIRSAATDAIGTPRHREASPDARAGRCPSPVS